MKIQCSSDFDSTGQCTGTAGSALQVTPQEMTVCHHGAEQVKLLVLVSLTERLMCGLRSVDPEMAPPPWNPGTQQVFHVAVVIEN